MADLGPVRISFRGEDTDGVPLASGKLYTYEAGTTTPKATFTDSSEAVENANPIILDSDGYADLWLGDGTYKLVLKDSNDATIKTLDNVAGDVASGFASSVTAVTGNLSVTTAHQNSLLTCTSSPTLSLLAAATAGEGFAFLVANADEGKTTIDPNASETINGLTTLDIAHKNGSVIVISDGTNWHALGVIEQVYTLAKTGAYTVLVSDHKRLILADASGGAFTITFPPVATAGSGFTIGIKKTDSSANAITADGDGAETIDGAATDSIAAQYQVVWYVCDGTEWHVSGDILALLDEDGFTSNSATAAPSQQSTNQAIASIEGNKPVISNDTDADHDINITAGYMPSSDGAIILRLGAEITKQIDATWAAGDDAGGLFSGTVANSTWYHFFLIQKDSDGSIDAGFDTSVTAANIPSGYTAYALVHSVLTDGSANIRPFTQIYDRIIFTTPIRDVNDASPGTTANTATLSTPTGYVTEAFLRGNGTANSHIIYVSALAQTDSAPSDTAAPLKTFGGGAADTSNAFSVYTNTSAQIRYRSSSDATTVVIVTDGWRNPNY